MGALVAGFASWGVGEYPQFGFTPTLTPVQTQAGTVMSVSFEEETRVHRLNATLGAGVLGSLVGITIGLSAGLSRGRSFPAIASGVLGAILGTALAVAAATLLLPIFFRKFSADQEASLNDLLTPLLVRSGIWGAIGAAGGLALAAGLERWGRLGMCVVAGIAGGAVGAVVYEVVGALAFASARTSQPIANVWAARLLAGLCATIGITVFAGLGAASSGHHRKGPKTTGPSTLKAG